MLCDIADCNTCVDCSDAGEPTLIAGGAQGCSNWPEICMPEAGCSKASVPCCRRHEITSFSDCSAACQSAKDDGCVGMEFGHDNEGNFCVLWKGCCKYRATATYHQYKLADSTCEAGTVTSDAYVQSMRLRLALAIGPALGAFAI